MRHWTDSVFVEHYLVASILVLKFLNSSLNRAWPFTTGIDLVGVRSLRCQSKNPRWKVFLWNVLSDPLSWITELLWRNIGENNALPIVSSKRTISPTGLFLIKVALNNIHDIYGHSKSWKYILYVPKYNFINQCLLSRLFVVTMVTPFNKCNSFIINLFSKKAVAVWCSNLMIFCRCISFNRIQWCKPKSRCAKHNQADGNWDINFYYFLTCAHASRRAEPKSKSDPRPNHGPNLNGVQLTFCSEPRWCNVNCGWNEIKLKFECISTSDQHWCNALLAYPRPDVHSANQQIITKADKWNLKANSHLPDVQRTLVGMQLTVGHVSWPGQLQSSVSLVQRPSQWHITTEISREPLYQVYYQLQLYNFLHNLDTANQNKNTHAVLL